MSIRRFELERYCAGELQGDECRALERRLSEDPEAAAALDSIRREQADFERAVPYAGFRVEHERRRDATRPRARRWLTVLFPLTALGAAAFLVSVSAGPGSVNPAGETRIKGGGAELVHYVQRDGAAAVRGTVGEALAPGAVVQLVYDAPAYRYGAVFGVDGSGTVTQFWPSDETMARLPNGAGAYPFSLTLDHTPGRERFYAVFAAEPLSLTPVLAALEGAGEAEPTWPRGVVGASTWIEKYVPSR